MPAKSIQRFEASTSNVSKLMPPPPPVTLLLEEDFMPLAARRESSLEEEICYPSHKTTFVCLPGPSKPLTRLGSTQRQQSLSSLPLSPSLPPLHSLPFCSSSFASTMQTFSGLSAPPLLRELQHKTSLCRQTAVAHTYTHRGTNQHTGA